MSKTYWWHKHPRGFANECIMIRTRVTDYAARLAAENDEYTQLSVKQARQHASWVNAENDAWGSGRAFGRIRVQEVEVWSARDFGAYPYSNSSSAK